MIRIGKLVATHGLKGNLILSHIVGNSKWLKKGQALFVELQKGSHIPYFVADLKASANDEYIVQLEDIDKIESAKRMVSKHVYVQEDILAGHADDSPLLWIGFHMTDKKAGSLGVIEDVLQTGSQWLAKLTIQDKEVLIPLIEQMVKAIDIKKKTITTDLPEGLLEIYL